jgi:Cu+-exporting ATPase
MIAAAAMAMSSVSVVTNALRLRGFRPPASVRDILNPPLRARIADAGYLVAIGLLALAIGAGALWLSERSGMGITNAAPDHGAMTTQNEAAPAASDHDDGAAQADDAATNAAVVSPEAAGLSLEWSSSPGEPQVGQPVTVAYRLVDDESGEVVTDLPLDHERPMHLILTSRNFTEFQHVHPELGEDGTFRVEVTLPAAGTYLLFDEFVHDGQTVLDERELIVGEPTRDIATLTPDLTPKTIEGRTVELIAPESIAAGQPVHFQFAVSQDDQPVTDLAPYLGAAAHVAILSEDTTDFAHTHGEAIAAESHDESENDDHGAGEAAHDVPAAFGPAVEVEHTFAAPGTYKVWVQFNHDGQVLTAPFAIEVE